MWARSLGRGDSPGGGHSNPLQYSCLENPVDRGTWQTTVLLLLSRFSRVRLCATPWTTAYQAPPSMGFSCPSPNPGVHSDSCPSSRWCHPAISIPAESSLFQRNGLKGEKQHKFSQTSPSPQGMGRRFLSQFQLQQSDIKIRVPNILAKRTRLYSEMTNLQIDHE